MAQNNDCKFDALRAQGYTGAIDDMERDWGLDNNLPEGTTGTPWYNALIANGLTPAHINDMEAEFWCNQGGSFSLQFISGFTNGDNCAGGGLYTLNANNPITFTSHAGVTLFNVTTGDTATVVSTTNSAAQQIEYTPTWAAADPKRGEEIRFLYDSGLGNYEDVNSLVDTETLNDEFIGGDAALNGQFPDITGTTAWAAGGVFRTNGLGQVVYNFTANSQIALNDVGFTNKRIVSKFRFTSGATTSNSAGFVIRGTDTNNVVCGIVVADGTMHILNRDTGADSNSPDITIGLDPRESILTYECIDDGVNVSIRCIETGAISSVSVGVLTIPADNNTGLFARNVTTASQIIWESQQAFSVDFEQMQDQDIRLTNCIDLTQVAVDFDNPLAAGMISAQYFDPAVVLDSDIYRDLAGNGFRALEVTQIQDFLDVQSGDTLSHQGYTFGNGIHYAFDTDILYSYPDDASWLTTPVFSERNLTPFTNLLGDSGHIGDGQFFNNQLIASIKNLQTVEPFSSQIVFFDVTSGLPYQHHVLVDADDSGAEHDVSALAVDEAKREILVTGFNTFFSRIFVYDYDAAKAAPAGSVLIKKRVIDLSVPMDRPQGLTFRNSTREIYASLNDGDIMVYDEFGVFKYSFYAHSSEFSPNGGNQGIDYSTNQLRLCKSNAAAQGTILYFDIDQIPAKTPTFDGIGERLELYHSRRIIFDYLAQQTFPTIGTIVAAVRVRSGSTRIFMDIRESTSAMAMRSQDSAAPFKFAASHGTGAITTEGMGLNTYEDVALTFDIKDGVVAESTGILNGTQTALQIAPWIATPTSLGLGGINRFKGSTGDGSVPDHDLLYFYIFDEVKLIADIDAIHADPTGILK